VWIFTLSLFQTGTGALLNDTRGMALSDEIWDDADAQQMALIPPDAIHRQADLAVINADEEGNKPFSCISVHAI